MGVDVHRAKHTLVGDQRQGHDAVYAQACYPRSELRPAPVTAQGARHHESVDRRPH